MEELSKFKRNIITWYPIKNEDNVLEISNDIEIINELREMSLNVTSCSIDNYLNLAKENQFDYIVLVGILDKLDNKHKFIDILNFSKSVLKDNGKILLVMSNKYGMKYWTGEKFNEKLNSYKTIISSNENTFDYKLIKEELDKLNLKYKFYYPFSDYETTNVIYTDEYMPDNDSIDARILDFTENSELITFSEREALKEILKNNKELFSFFANSYFIEISKDNNFSDIRYVSFGITRKDSYSIKTCMKNEIVEKSANLKESQNHIEQIGKNIEILNNLKIKTVDKYEDGIIKSKYLVDSISFDKYLLNILNIEGLDKTLDKIREFKEKIYNKFPLENKVEKNIFDKYEIDIPKDLLDKMHFIKDGLYDLIFQNCLIKDDELYIYDQEWIDENLPIEFILYRALFYFTELKNKEDINKIYEQFEINIYIEYFERLEKILQEKIVDNTIWELHRNSTRYIGKIYEVVEEYKEYISRLENSLHKEESVHTTDVQNLTNLIVQKDQQLVDYANQLRGISNSFSWKITKPLRIAIRMFNPFNGLSLLDRFYPIGTQRRLDYDTKHINKILDERKKEYYKFTDVETAKFWEGIDHRLANKEEKYKEFEEKNELLDYDRWIKVNELSEWDIEKQVKTKFKYRPKISIVIPLYNTTLDYFRELLYSIHRQTYTNWELCLADGSPKELIEIQNICKKDKRIKYKYLNQNLGISGNTNKALEMATGDYIALVDHDDMLSIDALYQVVKELNNNKELEFLYSDEDKFKILDARRYDPNFKPDFAIDTLRSQNYICHLSVFKNSLMKKLGGFKSEYDGAQDYDLILRMSEIVNLKNIKHIAKMLYHWRVHENSTAMNFDIKPEALNAGKKALEDHINRIGLNGNVTIGKAPGTYEVEYIVKDNPKISILIPNKDGKEILEVCINSILNKSTYNNYEIVVIENNSQSNEIFEYYKEIEKNNKIKVLFYPEKGFNYSKIINYGVLNTSSDYIIQLNNDIEIITSDWLEKMLGYCQRDDVGAVGVRLNYPDGTIQHAGVLLGLGGIAGHLFKNIDKDDPGYLSRTIMIQNLSAVTAACIMTNRKIYDEVDYMNEELAVAFNDIDFCMKIRKLGYLIIYNPYVQMIHYESKTRGQEDSPEKVKRFNNEIDIFKRIWQNDLDKGDPYYNKNLRLDNDQYAIKIVRNIE